MTLSCVRCHESVLEAREDGWACPGCGAAYPVTGSVARFVVAERYSTSFGYQWRRFSRTQLDSDNGTTRSRDAFLTKTGWTLEALAGQRVLDAGCGMGRFAEVCADAGADVHAVDLSLAVDAAAGNLGHRANVRVYQADIMALPFAEASFDLIYSIGVLHHTPDTRAAFLRLVPLLAPGGSISIWVYSEELLHMNGGRSSERIRRLTSRLPPSLLLAACWLAVPKGWLLRWPRLVARADLILPTSHDPDPAWRWLDTFDWYAPAYQWKHTPEEVEGWFREAGMIDIARGEFPVSVRGRRPA